MVGTFRKSGLVPEDSVRVGIFNELVRKHLETKDKEEAVVAAILEAAQKTKSNPYQRAFVSWSVITPVGLVSGMVVGAGIGAFLFSICCWLWTKP